MISLLGSFVVIAFMGFFIMMYFLKVWVDHSSYEAAVCIHSYPHPIEDCQKKLNKQLAALWPSGTLTVHIEKKTLHELKETFCL